MELIGSYCKTNDFFSSFYKMINQFPRVQMQYVLPKGGNTVNFASSVASDMFQTQSFNAGMARYSFTGLNSATGSFTGLVVGNKGLTASTGYFNNNLTVVGGITSTTGYFNLGISGATGSFDNITASTGYFRLGVSGLTGSFDNLTASTGYFRLGVSGLTGSFDNLTASTGYFRLGVSGATGSFVNVTASTGYFTNLVATGTFQGSVSTLSVATGPSPISAVYGITYLVDTAESVQIDLPAPAKNAAITIKDYKFGATAKPITITSGVKIDGADSPVSIAINGGYIQLISDGNAWFAISKYISP
jgi:hypothetical protein